MGCKRKSDDARETAFNPLYRGNSGVPPPPELRVSYMGSLAVCRRGDASRPQAGYADLIFCHVVQLWNQEIVARAR